MAVQESNKVETLDRRQRRTRKLMKLALKELIHEQDYDNISVTDISERADITRNTFYNHFESKDALLLSIIEDAIETMFQGIDMTKMRQLQINKKFTRIKKKPDTSLFSQDADGSTFLQLGLERFAPTILSHYAKQQMTVLRQLESLQGYEDSSLGMLNLFIAGGTLALVGSYLEGNLEQSSTVMDEVVGYLAMTLVSNDELNEKLNDICM